MGASSVPGCCVLKIWMSGRLLYCVPRDMTGAMLSFDTRKIPETRAAHRGPAFRCGSSRPPCGKKEKGLEEEKCPNKRSDGDRNGKCGTPGHIGMGLISKSTRRVGHLGLRAGRDAGGTLRIVSKLPPAARRGWHAGESGETAGPGPRKTSSPCRQSSLVNC
jgi:hypothetical protein